MRLRCSSLPRVIVGAEAGASGQQSRVDVDVGHYDWSNRDLIKAIRRNDRRLKKKVGLNRQSMYSAKQTLTAISHWLGP